MIKIVKSKLDEVYIVQHSIFIDNRGKFIETFNEKLYKKLLPPKYKFVQDDFSYSKKNVIRGFHGEKKIYKLVSCIFGKIKLAIFCNKPKHKDYLRHFTIDISSDDCFQIFVPPMYGICHKVLSDNAIFHYKQTGYYNPNSQFTFPWKSKELNINWGEGKPILSNRDDI